MKEKLLQFLVENTDWEKRYTGGAHEPSIITFIDSEDFGKSDADRKKWLSFFVDRMLEKIDQK